MEFITFLSASKKSSFLDEELLIHDFFSDDSVVEIGTTTMRWKLQKIQSDGLCSVGVSPNYTHDNTRDQVDL
jgi:hypothetical protein